jgi:myo-inositol-1(or 4)-monophosphatase
VTHLGGLPHDCDPTRFTRALEPLETAWLTCILEMAAAGRAAAAPLLGTDEGRAVLGRGAGGDFTVELDRVAEAAILAVLRDRAPAPFHAISEEAGSDASRMGMLPEVGSGPAWRVIIDPVDGSLNAKRGLEPCCAAIAVADGAELAQVRVGAVFDYSRGHVFAAVRGAGVQTSRRIEGLSSPAPVEILLLEAGKPDRHSFMYRDLALLAGPMGSAELRVRQIGSLALSLCQVASGAADILLCPVASRSVDIAAGLLILEEAGGGYAGLDAGNMRGQPLDLERRAPFVAWRRGLDGAVITDRAIAAFGPRPVT